MYWEMPHCSRGRKDCGTVHKVGHLTEKEQSPVLIGDYKTIVHFLMWTVASCRVHCLLLDCTI